jgi:demethylsterigmatocystin 6-O-methyltransferase
MKSLGHLMALQRGNDWIESFPVEKEIGSFSAEPEKAILVDVGGGFGQQAITFKTKFPNLPGRIIVQDIPSTLDQAKPVDGIEFLVHDFFQPQPIQEAKFYYFRHVLHNWTEADCIKILQATIPALGPDSRIVIDEVVLPDTGVPWQAAYLDITMMSTFGSVERTKTEWESLLHQAGLKIVDIHNYDDTKMQSVIVAVPK